MKFLESDLFSPLDRTFAKWMAVQTRNDKELIALLAALVSRQLSQGNTCLDLDETIRDPELSTILPSDFISKLVHNRQWNSTSQQPIVIDDNKAYLHRYWRYEQALAENILSLSRSPSANLVDEATLERALDLNFTADNSLQRKAARTALTKSFCIITGGPGTGKTGTTRAVIQMFQSTGHNVLLAAPTGRAAKRLSETTGGKASTIHRLLEYKPAVHGFDRNENNPLEADLIILDETSMVDTFLMYHFLKAVKGETRLLFVGDADQLPSVGAGNVLRDLISSGRIPVVRLDRIFRQESGSTIVDNAHRINRGEMPVLNAKGTRTNFYFFSQDSNVLIYYCDINLSVKSFFANYINHEGMHSNNVAYHRGP